VTPSFPCLLCGLSLFTHAAGPIRIETVVANWVRTLGWDMLGELKASVGPVSDIGLRHRGVNVRPGSARILSFCIVILPFDL
jgi:hypothetical protein